MALVTAGVIAAALAAAGIILILGLITYAVIKEKLRNKGDFFKAKITNQETTMGVPVVTIDLEDRFGNSVDTMKLASLDGTNVSVGSTIYKSEL